MYTPDNKYRKKQHFINKTYSILFMLIAIAFLILLALPCFSIGYFGLAALFLVLAIINFVASRHYSKRAKEYTKSETVEVQDITTTPTSSDYVSPVQNEPEKTTYQPSDSYSSSYRIYKGKRVNSFVSDYTIIDLETTGLSPTNCKIIELSAIKVRENKIVDTYSMLVNPETHISSKITQITNITDDMVKTAPTIEQVLPEYLSFIGTDIVIGHNVQFDISFIYDNNLRIANQPFRNCYIDTLALARKALPQLRHHRLADIADYYNIVPDNAHRALCDCETTYKIYNNFKDTDDIIASSSNSTVTPAPASAADEILKYKNLLDSGVITQEEFEQKKKQLLDL